MIPPRRLHFQTVRLSNFASESANVPEDQVKCRLLLDVVVAEGAAILELLTSEDQSLLVRGDATRARSA